VRQPNCYQLKGQHFLDIDINADAVAANATGKGTVESFSNWMNYSSFK
jgi:hypothetical protein